MEEGSTGQGENRNERQGRVGGQGKERKDTGGMGCIGQVDGRGKIAKRRKGEMQKNHEKED